jgi:hypothetical protein
MRVETKNKSYAPQSDKSGSSAFLMGKSLQTPGMSRKAIWEITRHVVPGNGRDKHRVLKGCWKNQMSLANLQSRFTARTAAHGVTTAQPFLEKWRWRSVPISTERVWESCQSFGVDVQVSLADLTASCRQ